MTVLGRLARRGLAALGVAALGMAAFATGASAEVDHGTLDPGNINPNATGSIIIHKHVDEESDDYDPQGDPLEGVQFRVTEILYNGGSLELATAEAWVAIENLTPAGVTTGPFSRATSSTTVTTNAAGEATAGSLGVGLYLVEEINSGPNLIENPADPFLVTIPYPRTDGWDYNVDVYPKNTLGAIEPTKTAGIPDAPANVELGAVVPFTISVPVPKPALDYVSFSISDSLSAGLVFESWGTISIGGVALTPVDDYTISVDNTTVTLTAAGLAKLNAAAKASDDGTTVTAVINATVNDLGQLKNEATVTINGEPGTTPEVTTNWARLDITKVDADNDDTALAGATFELWNEEKTMLLATGTTDANGELSFIVWVGNNDDVNEVVYLKETVAPQGYVLPADPWFGPYTLTAGTTTATSITPAQIDNYKPEGPELPLTGAQGTMIMTLGGLLLVGAGTGAIVVSRRNRNQVEA